MSHIVVLPGDGIGPEVTAEARQCLQLLSDRCGLGLTFEERDFGGIAIDRHGVPLPAETLEACKNAGAKKVIFASSGGAVYGEQEVFPAPESHATQPASPYGVSKRTGELYLSYYHQAFGLPFIALRYANVYGPRQSTKGEAGVVAIFLSMLLSGKTPIINGDGRQTRDYVYVADVVAANVAALESTFVGQINIGTGAETDVVTIYEHLREAVGSATKAQHGPAKTGEQRRSCLDAGRAAEILGWRPQMALRDGLQRTAAYYRDTVGR